MGMEDEESLQEEKSAEEESAQEQSEQEQSAQEQSEQEQSAQEQEEPAPEESEGNKEEVNEEAQKAAIDAERALRTNEPVNEDEESNLDIELSQSTSAEKDNDYPTDIKGLVFSVYGDFSRSKKEIVAAIEKGNGIYSKSLTKKTQYLVCNPEDTKNKAVVAAKKTKKIELVEESYLTNFY